MGATGAWGAGCRGATAAVPPSAARELTAGLLLVLVVPPPAGARPVSRRASPPAPTRCCSTQATRCATGRRPCSARPEAGWRPRPARCRPPPRTQRACTPAHATHPICTHLPFTHQHPSDLSIPLLSIVTPHHPHTYNTSLCLAQEPGDGRAPCTAETPLLRPGLPATCLHPLTCNSDNPGVGGGQREAKALQAHRVRRQHWACRAAPTGSGVHSRTHLLSWRSRFL